MVGCDGCPRFGKSESRIVDFGAGVVENGDQGPGDQGSEKTRAKFPLKLESSASSLNLLRASSRSLEHNLPRKGRGLGESRGLG